MRRAAKTWTGKCIRRPSTFRSCSAGKIWASERSRYSRVSTRARARSVPGTGRAAPIAHRAQSPPSSGARALTGAAASVQADDSHFGDRFGRTVVLHGNHLVVGEFVTLAANPVETLCVGVGVGMGVGVLVRDCKHALCTLQNSS